MSISFAPGYGLLAVGFYAVCIGLVLVLIYEERDPSTTLAWALLFVLFPGFGVLLYVLFGRNWRNIGGGDRKRTAALAAGHSMLVPIYARFAEKAAAHIGTSEPIVGRLVSALNAQNDTCPLPCGDVEIFFQGADKFARLFADIEAATDHVHLNYFIWGQDDLTGRFCDLLAEKIEQGVEVRLMYDWVGSLLYGKHQLHRLRRAGAHVTADAAKWQKLNCRNHRKIAVIDGCIGYTGGMNMGQEYIDGKPRYESWRDTHVRFTGPLVVELQRLFCERWVRTAHEALFSARYFPQVEAPADGDTVWAQIVHSGPESQWLAVRNAYLLAISSARKRIRIQSPYFVPDGGIEGALNAQCLGGVDAQLMMTGVPDKKIAWWAAFTYIDDFVEAGGRVALYEAGFFHPKTMTIDSEIAVIGTTNFDVRSFELHDELSIFFYSPSIAEELDAMFEADRERCSEVTTELIEAIKPRERMRNALARLNSRLL